MNHKASEMVKSVCTNNPYASGFARGKNPPDGKVLAYMRSFPAAYRSAGRVFDPVSAEYTDIELAAYTDGV